MMSNNKKNTCITKTISSPIDEIIIDVPNNLSNLENDEYHMVKLSKRNSLIVEAAIRQDPKYKLTAKNVFEEMINKKDFTKESYEKVIRAIAKDNRTRTPKGCIEKLAEYLADETKQFLERLQDGCPKLVDDLLDHLKYHALRKDKSLVSKICRYLNEWMYNKDDYTINDSIVRGILPYYLAYYKIDKKLWFEKNFNELSYVEFYKLFNHIKEAIHDLNRHELDHLIWYSYKSDAVRFALAASLAKHI